MQPISTPVNTTPATTTPVTTTPSISPQVQATVQSAIQTIIQPVLQQTIQQYQQTGVKPNIQALQKTIRPQIATAIQSLINNKTIPAPQFQGQYLQLVQAALLSMRKQVQQTIQAKTTATTTALPASGANTLSPGPIRKPYPTGQ